MLTDRLSDDIIVDNSFGHVSGLPAGETKCSAKTTKPPYSSLSILVVVLVHLIVRSETALVA